MTKGVLRRDRIMKKALFAGLIAASVLGYASQHLVTHSVPSKPPVVQQVQQKPTGLIPILMFHRVMANPIGSGNITPDQLQKTFEMLYSGNFTLVPLDDIFGNNIKIPAGKHPFAITVDDNLKNERLVSVYSNFIKQHNDFGKGMTFFVSTPSKYLGVKKDVLTQLLPVYDSLGISIGMHTLNHTNVSAVSLDEAIHELETQACYFKANGIYPKYFAYPEGRFPKQKDVIDYVRGRFTASFIVTGYYDELCHIYHKKSKKHPFDSALVPRIDASDLDNLTLVLERNKKRLYTQPRN